MEFSSDDLIADTIIKAVAKQEGVNAVLKSRGVSYRVGDIDIQMGIPPAGQNHLVKENLSQSLSL